MDADLSPKRARSLLLILLVAAAVLRLAWGLSRPADDAAMAALPDQNEYLQIARNVLDGQGFAFFDVGFNDTVYAYRMPGYPVFIAACGAKVPIVRIVQALLDTSSALAIYLLARRYLNARTALLAAALVAFNPYLVYFSATLLSETLFTALLAWGMLLLVQRGRLVFAAGILLLVASVYVRPSAIALPVLMALGVQLVRVVPPGRSFWRVPAGMLAILLLAAALLPWAYRNSQRVGAWVVMTTNGGITAYDGFNPIADGSSNQAWFRNWPELRNMTEVERSAYLGAQAREYAMQNPRRAGWLALKKLQRTWSPIPLSDEYGSNRLYVAAGLVFAVPLFGMVLLGMWYGRISRSLKLYLLLPALYFTAVHAVSVGSLRYRVPADAPMAMLAAAGAVGFAGRPRKAAPDNVG